MSRPPVTAPEPTSAPLAGYLIMAGLTLVWGINWPIMKLALAEVTVFWFRAACLVIGGIGLMAISAASGNSIRLPRAELRPTLVCTLFAVIAWHVTTGFGLQLLPAGRSAIIAYTMPVWAALLSTVMLGEPLTRFKVIGLALGIAGLAILIGPDLDAMLQAPAGVLLMLTAAITWAIGTILFKRARWTMPVATITAWQLLIGAVPICIAALLLEPVPEFADLSPTAIAALAYALFLPMLFGQWAFFSIVNRFPASVAAVATLAVPVVGVLSSAQILGERVGRSDIAALLLIVAALASVLLMPAIVAWSTQSRRLRA